MAAIPNGLFFTMALFLVFSISLPTHSAAGDADIMQKFNARLQGDKEYESFFYSYYSSIAPLAVFRELNSGKKVTMLIPSKAAFAKISSSLKKNPTKFGNLIANHCVKNKIVDYNVWKKTKDGSYWTANYRNRKIVKETRGFSLSDGVSKAKVVEGVVKWNVFSSPSLVAHAVGNYTITTLL